MVASLTGIGEKSTIAAKRDNGAKVAGHATAAYPAAVTSPGSATVKIWLTFIHPEGTDPHVQMTGDTYCKADHMPMQDN